MKLKQQPEDFRVEELTDVRAGPHGPFALYLLEKKGWTTPDALAALRRRWQVAPQRLSYGGLKDRHAWTRQYLTIFHGPRRNLRHHEVAVRYLGQTAEPYTSRDIRANLFDVVVRAWEPAAAGRALARVARVRTEGVPNYFDDQRFGSVDGEGGEFVARLLVRGRFEEALRQALVAPYAFDRADQKREKQVLAAHWGDWAVCKDKLPRGHARSLVDYLRVHPGDYRGAVARLRPELRGLYLSAYQSFLWNRMLALWLQRRCRPEQLYPVPLRLGPVPFHSGLDAGGQEELARLTLPLPSARLRLDPNDPRAEVVGAVLAEEGLGLGDLQVREVRELFFSKGERPALCLPADLAARAGPDENHTGKDKLVLSFALPRGCYATLVVKALQFLSPTSEPAR